MLSSKIYKQEIIRLNEIIDSLQDRLRTNYRMIDQLDAYNKDAHKQILELRQKPEEQKQKPKMVKKCRVYFRLDDGSDKMIVLNGNMNKVASDMMDWMRMENDNYMVFVSGVGFYANRITSFSINEYDEVEDDSNG